MREYYKCYRLNGQSVLEVAFSPHFLASTHKEHREHALTNLTCDLRGQKRTGPQACDLIQLSCASREPSLDYRHRNSQKEEQALRDHL